MVATSDFCRLAYKKYPSAAIAPGTPPDPATDPTNAGGQILRYTTSSLALARSSTTPAEVRSDLQVSSTRLGLRTVGGSVNGELSPGTYADLFAAVFRADWEDGLALDEGDLTSVAFDADAGTATFAGGDPIDLGLRVGMPMKFGNLATAGNNNKWFFVTGFGGDTNRTVSIYPKPITEAADVAFTLVTPKRLVVPSADFVLSKFLFEHYYQDTDIARLFVETMFGAASIAMPAEGNATVQFDALGRGMTPLDSGASPFFGAPTDPTDTDICNTVSGILLADGVPKAIVTSANLKFDIGINSVKAAFSSGYSAGTTTKKLNATGDVTLAFIDNSDIQDFDEEIEGDLLLQLTATEDAGGDFFAAYLPRKKLTAAQMTSADDAIAEQYQFTALKKPATPGYDSTTAVLYDTAVA